MLADLLKPHVHLGSFLLRVGLSIIFLFHGYLKLAQNNGAGWSDDLPEATQLAVAWGETGCGVAMLFGLFSRLAAVGIITIMVGAIVLQTAAFDFINVQRHLNVRPGWVPTGYEYNFAIIVMSLAVMAMGSGMVSIDHLLFGRRQPAEPAPSAPGKY
jgi:putative oxidoreductase